LNEIGIARELLPPSVDAVVARHGSPEFRDALADAECLVGFGDGTMDDAFYKSAPNLKLVQLLSAGYDRCDIEAARRAGVPICNNGGANSTAVSEHAILLMLAVCRRIVWQHTNVAAGRWRGNNVDDIKLYELKGRTLGIVGLGTIGKKTARLAQRHMQRDDVGRAQNFLKQRELDPKVIGPLFAQPENVVILHPHAERLRQARGLLADGAQPDDTQRAALQFEKLHILNGVAAPAAGDHVAMLPDQPPADR
jgi:hypothetical protein